MLEALQRLRANPALRAELVFVWADEATLLRRYTETRRRHPLAPQGRVADGIAAEEALTARLREGADLVIDTSDLPLPALRQQIERHFGVRRRSGSGRLVVSLVSFAYAHGLPREADLVFDARFLRNPHYDPILQPRTGLDPEVGAYIAADPGLPAIFRPPDGIDRLALAEICPGRQKVYDDHDWVYRGQTPLRLPGGAVGRVIWHPGSPLRPAGGENGVDWQLNVTHRELAREG